MIQPCFHSPARQDGMALVITLALVALLTIAVVAFFGRTTADRMVEVSRANRTRAELLARSSLDYATALFLAEIADPAHSTLKTASQRTLYLPKTGADILPRREFAPAIDPAASGFFSLVRQSVPAADANASAHSTDATARNGRRITPARWNFPALLVGDGFTDAGELPHWIYVGTDGVRAEPGPDDIGRFAYNVYEIGGLLNLNAAGFPGVLSGKEVSGLKGTPSGADLLRLSGSLDQDAVDALMAFRNASAAESASLWLDNVRAFSRKGFLTTTAESPDAASPYLNNYFVSRQDLLRYARTNNPAFLDAMPYVTHFSRSVNAPSLTFSTPTAQNPDFADVRFAGDTLLDDYDDAGTHRTQSVRAGDPVLVRRFSLARLAWLTPEGAAAGISAEAIRACFGLQWNGAEERWDYVGGGASMQGTIATLAEVAAANRAPDFFELLKAGILEATVGIAAQGRTMAVQGSQVYDSNGDLQILRIGANIIDCADPDNYPTRIAMDFEGVALEVAGVEDLPYIHSLWMSGLQRWDLDGGAPMLVDADLFWSPLLLNPHQPSPVAATDAPELITVSISNGILTGIDDNDIPPQLSRMGMTKSLADLPLIPIPREAADLPGAVFGFEDFRSGPLPMRNTSAESRLGHLIPYATADTDVQGFCIFSYGKEYTPMPAPAPRTNAGGHARYSQHRIYVNSLMMRLQFRTPGGKMKTYATLSGNDALPTTTGIEGAGGWSAINTPPGFDSRTDRTGISGSGSRAVLWDPRTGRFGPGLAGFSARYADVPVVSGSNERLVNGAPLEWNADYGKTSIYAALWPQGGRSRDAGGNYTNVPDRDGIFRPADGWLANAANPLRQVSGQKLKPDHASRPVILQRPYRSVAELGYVFRDTPWKTLSFFDESSGDGALLDLFSVVDEPAVTAGAVHLGTRHLPVLEALFYQSGQNADGSDPLPGADKIAEAYRSYLFASGEPTEAIPANVAELVRFMSSGNLGDQAYRVTFYPLKNRREAVVRALAGATQTRTWNLLIDVIAQSGRFRQEATDASDFIPEGEQRYWLSLAIDRYTGEVVARQLEPVNE